MLHEHLKQRGMAGAVEVLFGLSDAAAGSSELARSRRCFATGSLHEA